MMTPETEAYSGLLLSHLQGIVWRLGQMTPAQWDYAPAPYAPTARLLAQHTWQWLICDRQHINEPDARHHAPVPDPPAEPEAMCAALAQETGEWQTLLASLTSADLDEPRSQFNQYPMTVRGFVCHIIQNTIYKHGQLATLFFALGLDGTAPYEAPLPNPIYQSLLADAEGHTQ